MKKVVTFKHSFQHHLFLMKSINEFGENTMIIAVLTGGQSTRFGSDKLIHNIEGKQVINRVIEPLKLLGGEIYFLGKPMDGFSIPFIADHKKFNGPMAGLQALLFSNIKGDIFLLAGDMPFVMVETFRWYLSLATQADKILIPKTLDGYEHVLHIYISEKNRELLKQTPTHHSAIYKLINTFSDTLPVPEEYQAHFTNMNEKKDR